MFSRGPALTALQAKHNMKQNMTLLDERHKWRWRTHQKLGMCCCNSEEERLEAWKNFVALLREIRLACDGNGYGPEKRHCISVRANLTVDGWASEVQLCWEETELGLLQMVRGGTTTCR